MFGDNIHWVKDYNSALAIAKNVNKLILMTVNRKNCPFCDLLEVNVLEEDTVTKFISKNFVPLKVTQKDGTYPAKVFTTYGTPTTFFVKNDGVPYFNQIIGYVKKKDYLRYFKLGDRKTKQ